MTGSKKLHIFSHTDARQRWVSFCGMVGVPLVISEKPTCKRCIANKLRADRGQER